MANIYIYIYFTDYLKNDICFRIKGTRLVYTYNKALFFTNEFIVKRHCYKNMYSQSSCYTDAINYTVVLPAIKL